ncbi:acyl-[ACP]--phospholipid O-acyltransferase [Pseudodesulfovibrio sediminis]|uniref:Acyl-[ACP]--phospholipid O-acyltransferase n=1 Tax=Pseudodesulfovibrio sediminis TaxID=2810563 RepID=A0ABM7P956_9BACT|nr:acyl-[ACP]--phospholipid O-acyltransferase [Pseudodesulfovibrio sediminis]BCS89944.1 acyl-[ACP]--phospholipid O-acyltransferase [Pseudodesulfovibrio sediminis]
MRTLMKISGFTSYIMVVLLNAMTDLGHKIIIQNTVFKSFDGAEQIALTAIVNALILLPFILLFTPSAFISDRFSKNKVIKVCAAASIPLTILIVVCYYAGLFWPAFGLTFLLAAQSAVYSPAKYGYIKEMTGNDLLAQANAAVQAVTIAAILAGAVIFSVFFEHLLSAAGGTPSEILKTIAPCGYILVVGAVLETLVAFTLPEKQSGDSKLLLDGKKYLRGGYLKSNIKLVKKSEVIWLSIIGLAIFWAVNQVLLAAFGAHLKDVAGETNTIIAQGTLSLGGVGIIIGSIMAGKVSRNYIETGTIPLGAIGMTACLFFLPSIESRWALASLIFAYGIFGGLVIVPLNSLIQFTAGAGESGKVLAGNNFIQNIFMLGFLGLTLVMSMVGLGSIPLFYILAVVVCGGMVYTLYKLPQSLLRYVMHLVFSQRYNLFVAGLNNVPAEGGVLLLGNHVSWIDWAVLSLAVPRRLRFVMERAIYERWYLNWFLRRLGVIPISPRGSKTALKDIAKALSDGDCIVIFPEGAISRNGQLGEFKKGFEGPAKESGCTIIPFYLRGLWGSAFSFATPRLREMSRIRKVRDVTVCFGEPLSSDASAHDVKQSVTHLSIDAWKYYSDTFDPIHIAWLKTAKRMMGQRAVADSTGAEMSHRRLLATCVLVSRLLAKQTRGAQNVGVLLPASAGGTIANMALLMCGKTVVNLNYTVGPDSLQKALARAGIQTVVTSEKFVTRLKAKGFDLKGILMGLTVFHMETLKDNISKAGFLRTMAMVQVLPTSLLRLLFFRKVPLDSTAAILFSSGSEGTPKGVMLTHENIVGNVKQVSSLFNAKDDDVFLGALPLFHAFGLTATTFMPLIEGIPLVCHPDPTDARKIGQVVAKFKATFLCATPTFLGLYARNRRLHPLMFSSLRLVVAGAEKLNEEIRNAFKAKFGLEVYEGYGTTETTPVASVNTPDVINLSDFTVQVGSKAGTVGLPLPGSAFRIVDPQTLEDLPEGEAGLILIGGTQIMKGYLDDEQKTAEVIVEQDGVRWYKSGDKGRVDPDGFLVIMDRYSRFAKIGGEMVSLTAVEESLFKVAPGEIDTAAVAIPDAKKGERIVALVQGMEDPSTLKGAMLEAGVDSLSVPSQFYSVAEIPKLGTGKKDLAGAKKLALEFANA